MTDTDPSAFEVTYVAYADGSLEKITHPSAEPVTEDSLSKPGRIVSKTDYDHLSAQLEEVNAVWLADVKAQEQRLLKIDYDALRAAGIPEETARRITGYTGP